MTALRASLPRYQCHKQVLAAKIKEVQRTVGTQIRSLIFEDQLPITVDAAYVAKHSPQPGGYYVLYENPDGSFYESFSPAEAFESGYSKIESPTK